MSIKGLFIYLFIASILSIISIYSKLYFLLSLNIFLVFIVYKKYGSKQAFLVIATTMLFMFYKINKDPNLIEEEVKKEFVVQEVKEKYMIIKSENNNFLVYYIDDQSFEKNDEIFINGKVKKIHKDLDLDVFEFKDYLEKKRVFYEIEAYEIIIVKQSLSINNYIINKMIQKLTGDSYTMTKMLLFNDKYVDIDAYNRLLDINAFSCFGISFSSYLILSKKL